MTNTKRIFIYTLFGIGIASLARTFITLWNSNLPDFIVFYHYAQQLFQGINPYETEHIFSPPIALLLFTPTIFFHLDIAQKIWLTSSIFLFITSIIILSKTFKLNFNKTITIFSLSAIAFPLKFTLGMGQTNILILFFVSSFIYLFAIKKEFASVIFLSFAIALKIYPAILTFELIFLKKWKTIAFLAGVILTLLLIPIIFTGQLVNIYHIKNILFPLAFSPPTITVYYDQSITGFLTRFDTPILIRSFIRLFLISLTIFIAYKNKDKSIYAFILLLSGFLLINKFTWQHQLILLIPAFCYFMSTKLRTAKIILLTLAYLLLMINIKNPSLFTPGLAGNFILTHGFFGLFIIWIMLITDYEKKLKRDIQEIFTKFLNIVNG